MLGDNPEKSRNPLKKAMRRRNAKTVQFTDPTYYEPSDHEYSSEEEGEEGEYLEGGDNNQGQVQVQEDSQAQDAAATVEPLNIGGAKNNNNNSGSDEIMADPRPQPMEAIQEASEKSRSSEEMSNIPGNSDCLKSHAWWLISIDETLAGGKLRNGVVRNTDSFFKDDTIETKKINLTPSLLRDDSASSLLGPDPKEVCSNRSVTLYRLTTSSRPSLGVAKILRRR